MIDHDSSLSSKQISDLLKHICNQHLDFLTFAHPILLTEQSLEGNKGWNYFQSLTIKERYEKIYQLLNENTFKSTFLSFINQIKITSQTQTIHGTFICLRSHLENMFHLSQRNLNEINKVEKIRSFDSLKLFEYDENVLWNSEISECLLNNISVRSLFALQFFQSNPDDSNYSLIISSSLINNIELLQNEVTKILNDQHRYMVTSIESYEISIF